MDAFESGVIPLVASKVPLGAVVAELYAGIGLLGLNLAHRAEEVRCSDSSEFVDSVFDKFVKSLPEVILASILALRILQSFEYTVIPPYLYTHT